MDGDTLIPNLLVTGRFALTPPYRAPLSRGRGAGGEGRIHH
jgi:hypothetical protein